MFIGILGKPMKNDTWINGWDTPGCSGTYSKHSLERSIPFCF